MVCDARQAACQSCVPLRIAQLTPSQPTQQRRTPVRQLTWSEHRGRLVGIHVTRRSSCCRCRHSNATSLRPTDANSRLLSPAPPPRLPPPLLLPVRLVPPVQSASTRLGKCDSATGSSCSCRRCSAGSSQAAAAAEEAPPAPLPPAEAKVAGASCSSSSLPCSAMLLSSSQALPLPLPPMASPSLMAVPTTMKPPQGCSAPAAAAAIAAEARDSGSSAIG